jgi:hypothetical protein
MSGDYNIYALTEDERICGLGSILNESCSHKNITMERQLIHSMSTVTSNIKIRDIAIKSILNKQIDRMIELYAKDESLPNDFKNLAKQPNCLKVLLKGFFKQELMFKLDDKLVDEINELVELLYISFNSDIVYTRVSEIQQFIYKIVQQNNGKGSQYELNKVYMRNILSTARLHFSIYDIKNKSISSILTILHNTEIQRAKEKCSDSTPPNKYWKMKKMTPLTYYMSSGFKTKLNRLKQINIDLNQLEFKEKISKIARV